MARTPLANLSVDPTRGIENESAVTMPGLLSAAGAARGESVYDNMRVRYQRFSLSNPEDVIMLEHLETRAIRQQGIYVLSKDKTTLQSTGDVILILNYLEEVSESERPNPSVLEGLVGKGSVTL